MYFVCCLYHILYSDNKASYRKETVKKIQGRGSTFTELYCTYDTVSLRHLSVLTSILSYMIHCRYYMCY